MGFKGINAVVDISFLAEEKRLWHRTILSGSKSGCRGEWLLMRLPTEVVIVRASSTDGSTSIWTHRPPGQRTRPGRYIYSLMEHITYSDNHCLILYRAENLKRTIFYRFTNHEDQNEIAADLLNIRDLGYDVMGITTDGGDNIIRAIEYVFPDVPRQRCVVHVQRDCLASITQRPRSTEAKLFRNLVQQLTDVRTGNDKRWWLNIYSNWKTSEQYR